MDRQINDIHIWVVCIAHMDRLHYTFKIKPDKDNLIRAKYNFSTKKNRRINKKRNMPVFKQDENLLEGLFARLQKRTGLFRVGNYNLEVVSFN